MLKKDMNKLVWIREINEDDLRLKNHQSMLDVPLEHVLKIAESWSLPKNSFFTAYTNTPA
jgi:hypothetical protein